MGAGAVGSRAEHAVMAPALNRDEGGRGEVVFVHTQPVSSVLAAAQCQSCAELLLWAEESHGRVLQPGWEYLGQQVWS